MPRATQDVFLLMASLGFLPWNPRTPKRGSQHAKLCSLVYFFWGNCQKISLDSQRAVIPPS